MVFDGSADDARVVHLVLGLRPEYSADLVKELTGSISSFTASIV